MSIFEKLLGAVLGFALIVSVSLFSVPGLLKYYLLVEGNAGRRVFKLDVRVDAEHFNLTVKLVPTDESYKDACELFIAKATENELELVLNKKVDWKKVSISNAKGI